MLPSPGTETIAAEGAPAPEPTSVPLSPSASPQHVTNDPARTGYDPRLRWWINYVKIVSGRITAEGIEHYREDRYMANEARDVKRCEAWRDWLFEHSPTVRFLRDKIGDLNGQLDGTNVICRRCPGIVLEGGRSLRQSGGFSPDHGILLCANEFRDRGHVEDTMAHEMVHAWDHLRWKMDWTGEKDLTHSACTEIRAAMLSGECRFTREWFTRGNLTLTQQFQDCVRRRAAQSVMARPRCKDDAHAAKVVNQVWESCFSDTRPFDEIYR